MENNVSVYWFNAAGSEFYLSEEQLPPNKRHLYLVINRENLSFGRFSLDSKKRVKDSSILNIQGHFIPFKQDFMNFIYSTEKQKQAEKHFYFWVGALPPDINVESFFYDEIPESLLFKGNPETVKNYDLFVFQRVSGFEIIFYNVQTTDFYSLFEKDPDRIMEKILLLVRKFALGRTQAVRILTEIDIPQARHWQGNYPLEIDLMDREQNRYFFFPDSFPVKKKFSNLSQSRQLRSIKTVARQWSRNLTIILLLLLAVILVNAWGFLRLKEDNTQYKEKFDQVGKLLTAAEMIEFRLNKIKSKILQYPDHMLYMQSITQCIDLDSVLISYTLGDRRVLIEGYSTDSLNLLTCLRKSNLFKDVRFKTTVTKNVSSQREKFEIEILLKEPGTETEPGAPNPAESTEPTESMDKIESTKPGESGGKTGPTESPKTLKSTKSTGPKDSME